MKKKKGTLIQLLELKPPTASDPHSGLYELLHFYQLKDEEREKLEEQGKNWQSFLRLSGEGVEYLRKRGYVIEFVSKMITFRLKGHRCIKD